MHQDLGENATVAVTEERVTSDTPPFIKIDGVFNVRDIGSLPSASFPGHRVKPRILYRAATLSNVSDHGKEQVKALGIVKVFDMRSDVELANYQVPIPSISGIEFVRIPVFREYDASPEGLAKAFLRHSNGQGFIPRYTEMLDQGGPAFAAILKHIRDSPNQGCIFHCTAGKDRTGIAAALILKLAGVDDEKIARDYALTTIGLESALPRFIARLEKEPTYHDNKAGAMNMMSSKYETMMETLALLRDKYGGVDKYLKKYTELRDEDLVVIRQNLLVPMENE